MLQLKVEEGGLADQQKLVWLSWRENTCKVVFGSAKFLHFGRRANQNIVAILDFMENF